MVQFDIGEIRLNTRDEILSQGKDDENCALVRKSKKRKGKKSQSKAEFSQGGKKKDLSIIKYFHYHEFRHYAMKCMHKKTSKKTSGGEACEALASQFELEFTLIACMSNIVMGKVWYLKNNASFHMTRNT